MSSRSCVLSMCIVELKCHLDLVCVVCVYCGVEVSSRSCVCSMCIVELKCHLDLVCVVCVL